MKTKFVSDDGFEFESKYQCRKYEEAKENYPELTGLRQAKIDDEMVYEINNVEELVYYHEHINNGEMNETIFYDLFCTVKDSNHRFPIYMFSNSNKSDKRLIEIMEGEIEEENKKLESIKNVISKKKEKIKSIKSVKKRIDELHKRTVGTEQG